MRRIRKLEKRIEELEQKVNVFCPQDSQGYRYTKYVSVNEVVYLIMNYLKIKVKSMPSQNIIEKE
jgi:hypothetical protein